MNFIDAIRTGEPFRQPHWVDSSDKIQWCILAGENEFESCQILWEDGSTFGDITIEMLNADDFEVKSMYNNV